MPDNKKKQATLILSRMSMRPDMPEKSEEVGVEQDSDMGLQSAAEEVLAAVDQKDASALKEALKAFMEMCDYKQEEAPEAEEAE